MKQLWAPWRMTYIQSGAELAEECIFCAYPAHGAARHREHFVLRCDQHAFVLLNRFPYSNGHLLVVPRRHVPDLGALPAEEYQALGELLRRSMAKLREALGAHGLNAGMNLGRVAGAGIEHHCHWHIVPRWNGDTNFMPVVAETKVMSEHLEATYDRLLPHFADLGSETASAT